MQAKRIERYSRYEKFKDHIDNHKMEPVNDSKEILDQETSEIPDLEDKVTRARIGEGG